MKAVIYARFSCSKQREASIDDQLRVCAEWCAANGHEVVGTYCDYAVSGRTDERPEFQRMVANAGESELVVVYMMDRFSRDVYDAPIYKKKLRDAGVRVVSATESLPDGPEAMLMENIYEAMAAMESAHISQRTRRGMEGNALKCHHNGVRVFGYRFTDDGGYEVDEAEAALVRAAFAKRLEGESVHAVARWLASQGVTTSQGNPCSDTMARNMLKNEKYTGIYVFGKVRIEGGMPEIIDPLTFAEVQHAPSRNTGGAGERSRYPLLGAAVCGECGHDMRAVSGYGRGHVKYRYYQCPGHRSVSAAVLETAVRDSVRAILDDRGNALTIARAVASILDDDGSAARIEAARKQMDDAQRRVDNLTRAVGEGMPYADARPLIERARVEYGAAAGRIAMEQAAPSFDLDDFADFLQFASTLPDDDVLECFVDMVAVLDGHAIATMLFDDEKGEPWRVDVPLVRRNQVWLPIGENGRTMTVVGKAVLIDFPLPRRRGRTA